MKLTLKAARVNVGLTQTDVANAIGVSQAMIVKYEKGIAKPGVEKAIKMAELYSQKVEDLF